MQHLELAVTAAALRARTVAAQLRDGAAAEEGQTTAEYVAVIVLIAAIIGAVVGSDSIRDSVVNAINAAFGNVEEQVSSSGS